MSKCVRTTCLQEPEEARIGIRLGNWGLQVVISPHVGPWNYIWALGPLQDLQLLLTSAPSVQRPTPPPPRFSYSEVLGGGDVVYSSLEDVLSHTAVDFTFGGGLWWGRISSQGVTRAGFQF